MLHNLDSRINELKRQTNMQEIIQIFRNTHVTHVYRMAAIMKHANLY